MIDFYVRTVLFSVTLILCLLRSHRNVTLSNRNAVVRGVYVYWTTSVGSGSADAHHRIPDEGERDPTTNPRHDLGVLGCHVQPAWKRVGEGSDRRADQ